MQIHVKNILFGLCCFLVVDAWAQRAPRLRNFQPADYEAQNQNWSLAQSPEGWLYAGNNGTVMEFDGTRWRHFPLPEKQAVRAVAAGRSGEVFCGGFAEFGYWAKDASGRQTYTSLSIQLGEGQVGKEEIWHILVLPEYVLFQSFSVKKIAKNYLDMANPVETQQKFAQGILSPTHKVWDPLDFFF